MTDQKYDAILAIDKNLENPLSLQEAESLKQILEKSIKRYLKNENILSDTEWLRSELSENLPELSYDEVSRINDEIINTLRLQEDKKSSLENAVSNGKSKESWFADQLKESTSYMKSQETARYLQELDNALGKANNSLYSTIYTQSGMINQNPHLDGFIAEQYHAQTFNLNAEASGSVYRAKVLEPAGKGYAKNSVDIVIIDESGSVVRRYQSKYCKDASATAKAFEQGDYRGQQKLVPKGQEQSILKKNTTVLEAPDGTTSTPLSKEQAKELQQQAQSGKLPELSWNEYKTKDLAIGIGKQAGQAALMGAAISAGYEIAQKLWKGEEIEGKEIIKNAISSGADFGLKATVAGALKVGAEKGLINAIPKGTPAGTIADLTHVAVENVKIISKISSGELAPQEGYNKMEQTTLSTVAGIAASKTGSGLGATIGTVFGPVGSVVGGFIGGTVGYMAGSKVGNTIVKGAQKLREKSKEIIKSSGKKVLNTAASVANKIHSFCESFRLSGLFS